MSAKTNGRPLPPLLPLEYCTISRAAKMLDCEVDDFYHWAEIGAINLNVMLSDHIEAQILIDKNEVELASTLSNTIDGIFFGYSYVFSSSKIEPLELDPNTLSLNTSYLGGLWEIEAGEIESCILAGKDSFSTRILYSATDLRKDKFYVGLDDELTIQLNELMITRKQIEKLYAAITTGEPLANRFNTPEIAAKFAKRDGQLSSNRPAEYNSKSRTAALVSMCELFKKTKKLEIKPDKLQAEINEELLKHGIAEIDGQRTILKAYLAVDK